MGKKLFGRGTVVIDGVTYDTKKGITFDPGGVKRTPVPGSNSTGNFTEELEDSKLEAEILCDASVSMLALMAIDNGTLQVNFDTGQRYLVNGAYSATRPTAEESSGTIKIDYQGPAATEL